jgi:uncharacterized protein YbjT (DUF2867 family)
VRAGPADSSGRILIVGATGFLGSHVATRLAGRQPIALVRPTSDRSLLPPGLETRLGDLDQPMALDFDGIDTLVYCASMGFGHIPALIAQLGTSDVQRAIFISTTAIFTTLPSAGRALRFAAEDAVTASSLDWTILRPTMIYGTARDRNISRLLRALKRWPVFPLCGDALWQPVHVEDLAGAVVATLDTPATIGRTYNLPGAEPLPFSALVRAAAHAIGRKVLLLPVPLELAVFAARLTNIVTPEQIRRLAEDKDFVYTDAATDFAYAPCSFSDGVTREARSLHLTR